MNQMLRVYPAKMTVVEQFAVSCHAAFSRWNAARMAASDKAKTASVLSRLDARTLYDVGATDIVG